MSTTLRLRGSEPTVWVPKRRSCECGGSCGKCTANGGAGVMEPVRAPYLSLVQRRSGAVSWTGAPMMSRAVQRDDDTGSTNTSYGPGETENTRSDWSRIQAALAFARDRFSFERLDTPTQNQDLCPLQSSYSPYRNRQELEGVTELSTEAAASAIRLRGFEGTTEALFLHAWALLQNNEDLLEWSIRLVMGNDKWNDKSGDLADYLSGSRTRFSRRLTFSLVGDSSPSVFAGCDTGISWIMGAWVGAISAHTNPLAQPVIYVCGQHQQIRLAVQEFEDGAGRSTSAACAIIWTACLMFHELTHVLFGIPDYFVQQCEQAYRMENILRWALHQRYPGAADLETCCRNHESELFFNTALNLFLCEA